MIENADIQKIISKYDQKKLAIGTLGSHSSLNIFKGAKEFASAKRKML
jgi:5-formaminoimidazole-4-carboxamide-1-(beta)-D-ribofuranosyl 5'-monophosphate synthetase